MGMGKGSNHAWSHGPPLNPPEPLQKQRAAMLSGGHGGGLGVPSRVSASLGGGWGGSSACVIPAAAHLRVWGWLHAGSGVGCGWGWGRSVGVLPTGGAPGAACCSRGAAVQGVGAGGALGGCCPPPALANTPRTLARLCLMGGRTSAVTAGSPGPHVLLTHQ